MNTYQLLINIINQFPKDILLRERAKTVHKLKMIVPMWIILKLERQANIKRNPEEQLIIQDIPVIIGYEDKIILYHEDYTFERDKRLKVEADLTPYINKTFPILSVEKFKNKILEL